MVLLSKFEETLVIDGNRFDLSTNQYPGMVHPQGYRLFTGFRLEPFPIWTFKVDGIEIEKKSLCLTGVIRLLPRGQSKSENDMTNDKSCSSCDRYSHFVTITIYGEDEAFSLHIDSGDGYVSLNLRSKIQRST